MTDQTAWSDRAWGAFEQIGPMSFEPPAPASVRAWRWLTTPPGTWRAAAQRVAVAAAVGAVLGLLLGLVLT